MSVDPSKAAEAYLNAAKAGVGAAVGGASAEAAAGGPSFADMVEDAIASSVETIKTGEEMSAAAAKGEAELVDVVTAVAAAEVTLETVVAVRDKVISAYQQIMRMPI
ncbi:MAG: flagellar hook-basal body complex protein FliE [Pseudomonadota bacterium]